MAWLRRYKAWVASLMAIAVLGNVLAAATCCWPSPGDASGDLRDPFGPMIICSANGTTTLAPDEPGQPATMHKHCTMCVLVAAVALAVLALNLLGMLRPQGPGLPLDWRGSLPARSLFAKCGFMSRAPPLTA